ncbi:MAG TPA: helix-turn-helix domain-containing protein [Candidatus Angelobacter sp.]
MPKQSTESIESPRLLTIRQTAAYANATIWFVRNLIWSRAIPFAKFGNRLLIDRKDIDAYIDAQKTAVA